MRKHYFLGAALLLMSAVQAQTTAYPDSIVSYSSSGQPSQKTVYRYADDKGTVAQETDYSWDNGTWRPSANDLFTYDEAGNLTEWSFDTWNGNGWQHYIRTATTYDADGNAVRSDSYNWRENDWFRTQHVENSYDDAGRLSRTETYRYDYDNEHGHCIDCYTYDETGRQRTWLYNDTTWTASGTEINAVRENQLLDEQGRVIRSESTIYRDTPNERLAHVDSIVYNERGQMLLEYRWNYDADGNLTSIDYNENRYDDKLKTTQAVYRAHGSMNADKEFIYKTETWAEITYGNPEILRWMSIFDGTEQETSTTVIYYPKEGTTANEQLAEQPIRIQTTDGILRVTLPHAAGIQVYAISGKCVYHAKQQEAITVENLPAGIYIVRTDDTSAKVLLR